MVAAVASSSLEALWLLLSPPPRSRECWLLKGVLASRRAGPSHGKVFWISPTLTACVTAGCPTESRSSRPPMLGKDALGGSCSFAPKQTHNKLLGIALPSAGWKLAVTRNSLSRMARHRRMQTQGFNCCMKMKGTGAPWFQDNVLDRDGNTAP